MNVALWEEIIRVLTIFAAFFAFASVFTLWRTHRQDKHPARYLSAYLSAVLFASLLNRVYIAWYGLQTDLDSEFVNSISPILRAVGASILGLILFGIALIAIFYIKHRDITAWR